MKLEELSDEHREIFMDMTRDFQAGHLDDLKQIYKKPPTSEAEFKKLVQDCEKERMDWRPKAGKVSLTRYIMRETGGGILANGLLRFPLDSKTESDGGNLYCNVPPSLRGQGHGSYCLSLLLFEAVRAGLRRVLVTAVAEDKAARRVIEKNRGLLQDIVKSRNIQRVGTEIARYWISFSPS